MVAAAKSGPDYPGTRSSRGPAIPEPGRTGPDCSHSATPAESTTHTHGVERIPRDPASAKDTQQTRIVGIPPNHVTPPHRTPQPPARNPLRTRGFTRRPSPCGKDTKESGGHKGYAKVEYHRNSAIPRSHALTRIPRYCPRPSTPDESGKECTVRKDAAAYGVRMDRAARQHTHLPNRLPTLKGTQHKQTQKRDAAVALATSENPGNRRPRNTAGSNAAGRSQPDRSQPGQMQPGRTRPLMPRAARGRRLPCGTRRSCPWARDGNRGRSRRARCRNASCNRTPIRSCP